MGNGRQALQGPQGRISPIFWWCLGGASVCFVVAGSLYVVGPAHGIAPAAAGACCFVGGLLMWLGSMLPSPSWPFSRLWPFFAGSLALGLGAFWSGLIGMAWWVMLEGLVAAVLFRLVPFGSTSAPSADDHHISPAATRGRLTVLEADRSGVEARKIWWSLISWITPTEGLSAGAARTWPARTFAASGT